MNALWQQTRYNCLQLWSSLRRIGTRAVSVSSSGLSFRSLAGINLTFRWGDDARRGVAWTGELQGRRNYWLYRCVRWIFTAPFVSLMGRKPRLAGKTCSVLLLDSGDGSTVVWLIYSGLETSTLLRSTSPDQFLRLSWRSWLRDEEHHFNRDGKLSIIFSRKRSTRFYLLRDSREFVLFFLDIFTKVCKNIKKFVFHKLKPPLWNDVSKFVLRFPFIEFSICKRPKFRKS